MQAYRPTIINCDDYIIIWSKNNIFTKDRGSLIQSSFIPFLQLELRCEEFLKNN